MLLDELTAAVCCLPYLYLVVVSKYRSSEEELQCLGRSAAHPPSI
jgi:hypothetical protein